MASLVASERSDLLWIVCKLLPQDYQPWGNVDRDPLDGEFMDDCSAGCVFYKSLFDERHNRDDADWGVCCNPKSHRAGLLTWEHQGCGHFVCDESLDNG